MTSCLTLWMKPGKDEEQPSLTLNVEPLDDSVVKPEKKEQQLSQALNVEIVPDSVEPEKDEELSQSPEC